MNSQNNSNTATIPKILHQIWGGEKSLPEYFITFSQTWKENHPEWQYEFWDDNRISAFVAEYYPQYAEMFHDFTYNMQRWDTIRYMIMDIYGGIYADFDSECLKPLDDLLANKSCVFSLEADFHAKINGTAIQPATSVFGSAPGHPFIREIIKAIFAGFKKSEFINTQDKLWEVVKSTGPIMIANVYAEFPNKEDIHLIPLQYFASLESWETTEVLRGNVSDAMEAELEERLKDAFTVHYYFLDWVNGVK
jgi:mannosyltransferase OCH1-like enzyme